MNPETETSAPENLVDLMNKLAEPPVPTPVSLVPQTAGWAIAAGVLVIGAMLLARLLYRRYQANAYRRAALAAMDDVGSDPVQLALLLRQTALAAFPRKDVAGLYGDDWLAFLDDTCEGGQFRAGPGRFVARAPYVALPSAGPEGVAAVRHWIAHHKAEVAP